MKYQIRVFFILFISLFLISCDKKNAEFIVTEELESQEREEVNAMMGTFASDGDTIYMVGGDIIYRVDMEKNQLVVNCGDLLCSHESITCSAKLPYMDNFYEIKRNGDHVYVLSNRIYEIKKNSKKEIGHGNYGNYENKVLFGDYIAYFEKEDVVVVKHIKSDREAARFEDIACLGQGSFYYKEYLYYVTDTQQLVRLNLNTGKRKVLENKGATRASVYDGFIYYIKVSEEKDINCLIKMNPETLEKQELAEGVFYYNMFEKNLYYTSYPEWGLYCSDLNGDNQKEISSGKVYDMSWLWVFPSTKTVLFVGEDFYTFYLFDVDSKKINYDTPLIRPGKGGAVLP